MAVTAPQVFLKTPTEEKIFQFTVPTEDVATDETITAATISSLPSGVTWGSCVVLGLTVQSKATGGTVDTDYHVTLSIDTSIFSGGSQKLAYCGDLWVRAC
jgi:hypothetical protein